MVRLKRVLNGVLIVDKPKGFTSHDVVAQARRLFGVRALGHAGTLDPSATGVLLLLFGEACKLSGYLTSDQKCYVASVRFGVSTDSLDSEGEVLEERALEQGWLEPSQLDRALSAERERVLQIPPSVSAIHHQGERAHVRARRGELVELAARSVHVSALELKEVSDFSLRVELRVSKGYYVRAFARDLGQALGVPAHLAELRRLSSGAFRIEEAVAWPPPAAPPLLSLAEVARRALPSTQLDADAVRRARCGQRLEPGQAIASAIGRACAWFGPDNELIALGVTDADGTHRVLRGFVPETPSTDDQRPDP